MALIIEIEIINWDKYNARNDVKSCTWFRMSNDFFADPDFYGSSPCVRMVWIYVLCMASKKNNSVVRISAQMMIDALKISQNDVENALVALCKIGCIQNRSNNVISTRSDSIVTKMFPSATDRQTDRQTDSVEVEFVKESFLVEKTDLNFDATPWLKPLEPKKNLPEVLPKDFRNPKDSKNKKGKTLLYEATKPSLDEVKCDDSLAANALTALNTICGRSFRPVSGNMKYINARLNEGYSLNDFKQVLEFKFKQWGNDATMSAYLRPETIFGTKFDSYLQESENANKPKLDPLDAFFAEYAPDHKVSSL